MWLLWAQACMRLETSFESLMPSGTTTRKQLSSHTQRTETMMWRLQRPSLILLLSLISSTLSLYPKILRSTRQDGTATIWFKWLSPELSECVGETTWSYKWSRQRTLSLIPQGWKTILTVLFKISLAILTHRLLTIRNQQLTQCLLIETTHQHPLEQPPNTLLKLSRHLQTSDLMDPAKLSFMLKQPLQTVQVRKKNQTYWKLLLQMEQLIAEQVPSELLVPLHMHVT